MALSDTPNEADGEVVKEIETARGRGLRVTLHDNGLWVKDHETGDEWPVAASDILRTPKGPL